MFIELVPADGVQTGLFDQADDVRSINRMAAIDALNRRYGVAQSGSERPASGRAGPCAAFIPKRYTTAWGDLLRI